MTSYGYKLSSEEHSAPDLVRYAHADGSYASASDPRVVFGLGGGAVATGLEVRWPDGTREALAAPPIGRYSVVREGSGRPLPRPERP